MERGIGREAGHTVIKVFLSHSSRGQDTPAAHIREAVYRRLKDQYDVFLDGDRIDAGEEWAPRIHRELSLCQAAVVLLDRNALGSSHVRDEVAVLMYRQHEAVPPLVLAVLIDGVTSSEVKAAGFNSLDQRQYIRVDRPGDRSEQEETEWLIGRVTAQFAQLPPPRNDLHEEWVNAVADNLTRLNCENVVLQRAASKLAGEAGEFPAIAGTHLLAIRLLTAFGDLRVSKAVSTIGAARGRRGDDFQSLVALLLPSWVDVSAARRVIPPEGTGRYSVVLNVPDPELAEDYLAAATGFSPAEFAFGAANTVVGEDPAAELLQSMRDAVSYLVAKTDWNELSKYLPLGDERKFILIVSMEHLPRTSVVIEAIQKLHADLPEVVVLLHTRVDRTIDMPEVVNLDRLTGRAIFKAKEFRTALYDVAEAV